MFEPRQKTGMIHLLTVASVQGTYVGGWSVTQELVGGGGNGSTVLVIGPKLSVTAKVGSGQLSGG